MECPFNKKCDSCCIVFPDMICLLLVVKNGSADDYGYRDKEISIGPLLKTKIIEKEKVL